MPFFLCCWVQRIRLYSYLGDQKSTLAPKGMFSILYTILKSQSIFLKTYGAFHGYVCDQSYKKFPKICFIKPIWKSQIWANEHKTFNPILNLHKYASIRFLVTCHCYLQKKLPRLRVWRLCGQGFWINAASGNISVKYTKRDMNVDL